MKAWCVCFAMASVLTTACGQPQTAAADPRAAVLLEDRPRGMTVALTPEQVEESGGVQTAKDIQAWRLFAGPGQPPLPIFLNRFGGTYTPGPDDSRNNTSIVPNGTSTIGAYPYGDASWQQVVQCLTTMFAPYNVTMVETEPGAGEYVEAVIAGHPSDVGLPNGVGGVAPIDSFQCNIIPRAIVYAFADVYGNAPQAICETAAQEIAHAFSLDHEFHCPDPMTYLGGCGTKTFRDTDAQCGEYEPRQCNCNRPFQNSVQTLIEKLGAAGNIDPVDDPTPPTVAITSPANGATLLSDSTISITATASDDVGLAAVELVWNFTGDIFPCPFSGSGGAVTCTLNGGNATWSLRVGQGSRTFSVRARDVGGNQVTTTERTINLSADGEPPPPPPDDQVAPSVTIFNPDDGAVLPANSTITITAQAVDDQQLASVELVWTFTGDAFPCPFSAQNVSCTQDGTTYEWSLNVGVGTRGFQVRAIDIAGNEALSPERTVTLSSDAPPPPPPDEDGDPAEDNDDADTAFSVRCGSAMDLTSEPGDEDWFVIEAPADTAVSLDAQAEGPLSLTAYSADGQDELGAIADVDADGPIEILSPGPAILAKVGPAASVIGYRLTVTCADGSAPPPPSEDDELEDNDDVDGATRSFCGQDRAGLAALDDDVFVVSVRAGDTLKVNLTEGGVIATIKDADGKQLAGGDAPSASGLEEGDYYVTVAPTGDGAQYDVGFECVPQKLTLKQPQASGCACDASTKNDAVLTLLGLLGAFGMRRRRR
jgi:MYXO-CTERM domain-containing protein